jgi:hypothetical protein
MTKMEVPRDKLQARVSRHKGSVWVPSGCLARHRGVIRLGKALMSSGWFKGLYDAKTGRQGGKMQATLPFTFPSHRTVTFHPSSPTFINRYFFSISNISWWVMSPCNGDYPLFRLLPPFERSAYISIPFTSCLSVINIFMIPFGFFHT